MSYCCPPPRRLLLFGWEWVHHRPSGNAHRVGFTITLRQALREQARAHADLGCEGVTA
jgi:hypothetical protein